MRQPIIAGNWKMNGSKESVATLLEALIIGCSKMENVEWIVFPPYIYLPATERLLEDSNIAWGAQNISSEKNGAFTGEISASMLNDFHCRYVLIGHSERRVLFAETNAQISAKFAAALEANLQPILCVGETEKQRAAGQTWHVIEEQLESVFAKQKSPKNLYNIVIAYEPVWAIGTGQNATPEQAQEVHLAIRNYIKKYDTLLALKVRIIYGGSVNPGNAGALFAMPDVDGALVGGASLDPNKFLEIGKQCSNLS